MEILSVIEDETPRKGFHCLTPKFAIKSVQKSAKIQKNKSLPLLCQTKKTRTPSLGAVEEES